VVFDFPVCPVCGHKIPIPVTHGNSKWQFYTHRRGRGHQPCRLVWRSVDGQLQTMKVPASATAEEFITELAQC